MLGASDINLHRGTLLWKVSCHSFVGHVAVDEEFPCLFVCLLACLIWLFVCFRSANARLILHIPVSYKCEKQMNRRLCVRNVPTCTNIYQHLPTFHSIPGCYVVWFGPQGEERAGQYHDIVGGNTSEQRDTLIWCRWVLGASRWGDQNLSIRELIEISSNFGVAQLPKASHVHGNAQPVSQRISTWFNRWTLS